MYHVLAVYFYTPFNFTDIFPNIVGPEYPLWTLEFFEIKKNLMIFTLIDRIYDVNFNLHTHWTRPIAMFILYPNLYYYNFNMTSKVDLFHFYNETNAIRPIYEWLLDLQREYVIYIYI